MVGSSQVTRILIAFLGELFRVCNSNSFGLIVNLYQDDTMNLLIGALLLNPENRLSEGAKVSAMSRLASILLRVFAVGSILDPLGNLILNEGRVGVQYRWVIESPALAIIDRESLFEPLQTGILFIDSMIRLARGKPDVIFINFHEFQFKYRFMIFDFHDFLDF